jgi:multicomponent Na+:H+ antiporter subunit D
VAATVVLALAVVAFGVGFEPLYRLALDAGGAAIDTQGYVDAVLAAGNGGGAA